MSHLRLVSGTNPLASSDLADAWQDFLLSRQAMRVTEKTLEWYRYTAGRFVEWLEESGGRFRPPK